MTLSENHGTDFQERLRYHHIIDLDINLPMSVLKILAKVYRINFLMAWIHLSKGFHESVRMNHNRLHEIFFVWLLFFPNFLDFRIWGFMICLQTKWPHTSWSLCSGKTIWSAVYASVTQLLLFLFYQIGWYREWHFFAWFVVRSMTGWKLLQFNLIWF